MLDKVADNQMREQCEFRVVKIRRLLWLPGPVLKLRPSLLVGRDWSD